MTSSEILADLIAFPTVSADSNRSMIDYCAALFKRAGADIRLIEDDTGKKANLYATIGPRHVPGVLLSGHTDVVPVEGQDWTVPPFEMTERDGKLFGRGTTDMKGFLACALNAADKASKLQLNTPLHFAFTHDEGIGCVGVHSMIEMLEGAPFVPRFCIVGEPTSMGVATGHKGKTACRVDCTGREGHSALAPEALNAIYMATDLIGVIRAIQSDLQANGAGDPDHDVPYTTLHVGKIEAGIALNIVPSSASFLFEIRNLPDDDPDMILQRIRNAANENVEALLEKFPQAGINVEVFNSYPPLSTAEDSEVVGFVKSLTGQNATFKVAFGTEGGLFSSRLGIPTVICGPGSMAQGHKPDEFVAIEQLDQCDAMLDALLSRLEAGL